MTSTDNSASPRARVLAVVLSWNEHDWTERAVRSLVAQDIATDVLVVDNASEEDPTERFEALGERVSVERMPSNLGVAGGRNVGLRRALEGDWGWVLIFDNDAEAAPDMVRRLMEEGDAAERIGMVGPKIYRLDQPDVIWRVGSTSWKWTYLHLGPEVLDRIWRSAGRWPRRFLDTHRGRDQRDVGQFDTPEDVDFQIGCVQLIRTDTLRDVGLLDEDFSPTAPRTSTSARGSGARLADPRAARQRLAPCPEQLPRLVPAHLLQHAAHPPVGAQAPARGLLLGRLRARVAGARRPAPRHRGDAAWRQRPPPRGPRRGEVERAGRGGEGPAGAGLRGRGSGESLCTARRTRMMCGLMAWQTATPLTVVARGVSHTCRVHMWAGSGSGDRLRYALNLEEPQTRIASAAPRHRRGLPCQTPRVSRGLRRSVRR